MKHGTKTKLAIMSGIKPQVFCDYLSGRSGASAPVADRLAALTGTDIRVWLMGGSVEARRAAVEAWAAKQGTEFKSASGAVDLRDF